MEEIFFSKQNFNIIYNIIKKNIYNNTEFDISTDDNYNKELVEIMKSIYASKDQFNISNKMTSINKSRYLSQKTINIATGYILDKFGKTINNKKIIDRQVRNSASNNINHVSPRPVNQFKYENTTKNYEKELSNRQLDLETTPSKNIDFTKLTTEDMNLKSKNQLQNNTPFNPSSININKQQNSQQNNQPKSQPNSQQNVQLNISRNNRRENAMNTVIANNTDDQFKEYQNEIDNQNSFLDKQFEISNTANVKDTELTAAEIQRKFQDYSKQRENEYELSKTNLEKQFVTSTNNKLNNDINKTIQNINRGSMEENNQFNPPPQINPNIDISKKKTIENKEFKFINNLDDNIVTSDNLDMNPDAYDMDEFNPIDNNTITNNLNISTKEDQYDIQLDYKNNNYEVDNIIPDNMIDNNNENKSLDNVYKNNNPNINIDRLTDLLVTQQNDMSKTNEKINKLVNIIEKQDIDRFYKTIIDIPNLLKSQDKDSYRTKKHSLIISSRDRDLSYSEFNKYSFKINFGGENSNTIINDNFSASHTNNNTQLKNNTETSKSYSSTISKNPSVLNVLRNVVSISIKKVIIPKPRSNIYYPEPYYFIAIDEFESNMITSKNFNEKIFCKIHFDKELMFGDPGAQDEKKVRSFLYYKNDDDERITFYHSPLAKLNNLTIKLMDSRGRFISDTWGDLDFVANISKDGSDNLTYNTNKSFMNNTYIKDEIHVISNGVSNESRITNININDNQIILGDNIGATNNNTLINLSNQIEYVFEIYTKEHDLNSTFKSELL